MNEFNVAEILNHIESNGIKVIKTGYVDSKYTNLEGNLEDFITSVKAFGEGIVFMQELSFSDDEFLHKPKEDVLGDYLQTTNGDGISLNQFVPALEDFRIYIDQTYLLIFRVFYKNYIFAYWHSAEWYETFEKLVEEAVDKFEEKENSIKQEQEQEEDLAREKTKQRQDFLRTLLEDLADDDKFVSLRTQKAMQEYALARYPELNEFSNHVLKIEISNLLARIQARKSLM